MTTIQQLMLYGMEQLSNSACDHPQFEVSQILSDVLGLTAAQLLSRAHDPISDLDAIQRYKLAIKERQNGRPLALILGNIPFLGRDFYVEQGVLIPRPETEWLVDQTIQWIHKQNWHNESLTILELGVGSGVISLSLSEAFPKAKVVAWDHSIEAIKLAKKIFNRQTFSLFIKTFLMILILWKL